ncbi:MAG: trehalase-like domain-containing protein [Candidatus Bathyarchaeota archaeon]
MGYKPISAYGIIGNLHTAALVSIDGYIDGCCLPHFDSPSVFASILDYAKGGNFSISPLNLKDTSQTYIKDTAILETIFTTETGKMVLTDFMSIHKTTSSEGIEFHGIHRKIRCNEGEVQLKIEFKPRFDYARAQTILDVEPNGVIAKNSDETLTLSAKIPLKLNDGKVVAEFKLAKDEEEWFIIRYGDKNICPCDEYRSREKLESKQKMIYCQRAGMTKKDPLHNLMEVARWMPAIFKSL